MLKRILEIAEKSEASLKCTHFGIRQNHEAVSVGDELPSSWQQIDGAENYELDGTCCLGFCIDEGEEELDWLIDKIKEAAYQDGPIILVGGTGEEFGNDEGEVIIENAEVLAVIQQDK